jgi:2,3-bisphosphoglycerate-dependent phosphoglycerate mutase
METTTELYLVRHGRTDWNAMQLLQGTIERELDEEGIKQAHEVSLAFASHSLAAIYSSTMVRAKQTADIIASKHTLAVQSIEGLHECRYGICEGMMKDEYEAKFSKELEERKSLPFEQYLHYRIAEGFETAQEILDRVLPSLKEIEKKHRGKKVLIVCHGGIMRIMVNHCLQIPNSDCNIPNGGHIRLLYDGELFALEGV